MDCSSSELIALSRMNIHSNQLKSTPTHSNNFPGSNQPLPSIKNVWPVRLPSSIPTSSHSSLNSTPFFATDPKPEYDDEDDDDEDSQPTQTSKKNEKAKWTHDEVILFYIIYELS